MALKFYLTNRAAPYTPATIRGAWDDTAGAVTKALDASKTGGGAVTSVARAETNASPTYDVLLYRGVSGPLAAQTISGTVDLVLGALESSASADFYWHLHIYVTQGDSDTPRGDLLTDYIENTTNEWPTASAGQALQSATALSSLGISAGDRLVVEVGLIARNSVTTSFTGTVWYGTQDPSTLADVADLTVGAAVAALAGYVSFPSGVTEAVVGQRESQVLVEVASEGAAQQRVSQLVAEVASEGTAGQRVSQALVEVAAASGLSGQRYSQVATEVASEGAAQQRYSQVVVEVATAIPPDAEFSDGGSVDIGLTWVEITDKAATKRVHSKTPLPDRPTYYGGFKDDRVTQWGRITRALSDREGQYESAEFSWVQADTDRLYRGVADDAVTRVLKNRPATLRMIDDASRRLRYTPRTMMKGLIRDWKPMGKLQWQWTMRDILAAKFSSENTTTQLPTRLIGRADFPDCPTDAINRPVPIVYGFLGSTASATAPPTLTGTAALGSFIVDGFRVAGFGPSASAADVPTGVTVGLASGGTLPVDVPNGEYAVLVTAVDAGGVESEGHVYYYDGPGIGRGSFAFGPLGAYTVAPDGTQKIQVAWSASTGAVSYRAYLATYYYGARFEQFISTAGLSCEFTTGPVFGVPASPDNITPAAQLVNFQENWWYSVSAEMGDGETARSVVAFGTSKPYRRALRIEWDAVPGALSYKVYRRGGGGTWDRSWSVSGAATFFDDDLKDTGVTYIDGAPSPTGQVPVVHVGGMNDADGFRWKAFVVAGHAVKEITDVFLGGDRVNPGNFGVTWAVPGKPGYDTYFPNTGADCQYLDINGNRYTMLFVRGPDADGVGGTDEGGDTTIGGGGGDHGSGDGGSTITVNVRGIENVGDSTGDLIRDGLAQYLHAIQNWVLQVYESGAWLATPVFADETTLKQVDEASFTIASAVAESRIVGGYVGAWMLGAGGERISVRDFVARMNVGLDVDSGFNNKTQFFVSMMDVRPEVLAAADLLVDVRDVFEDSFDVQPVDSDQFNRIPYVYSRDYTGQRPEGWNYTTEKKDDDNIEAIEETKSSTQIELHPVRNTAQALDVITRRLFRQLESRRVTWTMGMAGLKIELGSIRKMDHYGGLGVNGYQLRPIRITRHETDPEKYTVTLEGWDVQRLFE